MMYASSMSAERSRRSSSRMFGTSAFASSSVALQLDDGVGGVLVLADEPLQTGRVERTGSRPTPSTA